MVRFPNIEINGEEVMSNRVGSPARVEEMPVVKIARMNTDIVMPKQAHDTDAGFDLSATTRVDIPPGCSMLIGTGLRMEIPKGYCGQINPRSSIASKKQVVIGARIIDSAYRGEVFINLINNGSETFEVVKDMRVAQIVFLPILTNVVEVTEDSLTNTSRGEGGFGSSGDK